MGHLLEVFPGPARLDLLVVKVLDELLLADFSRGVSAKSSALFYGNSLIVSSIPVWLYWRVHNLDPASSAHLLAIAIIVSTYLLAFAYKNTKYLLKHKIAVKREAAVTKEMNAKLADDKKISRKEKDERILWKKNEVAEYESTTFAPPQLVQQSIMLLAWEFLLDLLHYCPLEQRQHNKKIFEISQLTHFTKNKRMLKL